MRSGLKLNSNPSGAVSSSTALFLSPNNEKPARVCYLCGSPLESRLSPGKHAPLLSRCLEDYAA
jgi:hypothetical protein